MGRLGNFKCNELDVNNKRINENESCQCPLRILI
jgi:hypothetical protein